MKWRKIGIVCVCFSALFVLAVDTAGGKGSKVPVSQTQSGEEEEGMVKAHRAPGGLGIMAYKVEFFDGKGKKTRELVASDTGLIGIRVSKNEKYVATLEEVKGEENVKFRVRYYNAAGKELAVINLCCGTGEGVVLSEDGKVLAVTDSGEGMGCAWGYDIYPAPKGCFGVRVYSSNGKEIYRELKGESPTISPKGKYVVYKTPEGYKLLNTQTKRAELLPVPPGKERWPSHLNDDGVTRYSGRVGEPLYQYTQGKGLEVVGVIPPIK